MPAKIATLIDKLDNFERIELEIAAILFVESERQSVLAAEAGKDPQLWRLNVYADADTPIGDWLTDEPQDRAPIVNVVFDSDSVDEGASNSIDQQKLQGVFNIDCYGFGVATSVMGGHKPGEVMARLEAERCARLVRNILMADSYAQLGMRGIVVGRRHIARTAFQPQIDERPVQNVRAIRFALRVDFYESSPQTAPVELELVGVTVKRAADGKILFNGLYDYTT